MSLAKNILKKLNEGAVDDLSTSKQLEIARNVLSKAPKGTSIMGVNKKDAIEILGKYGTAKEKQLIASGQLKDDTKHWVVDPKDGEWKLEGTF